MAATSVQPMLENQYSKVVFTNICEYFETDSDILLRFKYDKDVEARDGDKICLLREGCTDVTQSFLTKESEISFGKVWFKDLRLPKQGEGLQFLASELPEAGEQYYQFCYFTKTGEIYGVSKHFRFVVPIGRLLLRLEKDREISKTLVIGNGQVDHPSRSVEELSKGLSNMIRINGELEERLKLLHRKSVNDLSELRTCCEESEAKSKRIIALEVSLAEVRQSLPSIAPKLEARDDLLIKEMTKLKHRLTRTLDVYHKTYILKYNPDTKTTERVFKVPYKVKKITEVVAKSSEPKSSGTGSDQIKVTPVVQASTESQEVDDAQGVIDVEMASTEDTVI